MTKLRRSLVINFLSSSGAALLQFITSIFLARLLSPSEIGVFSMAMVFVGIAHMFRDFGVPSYLQREANLTPEKIRSAIGVMFASTWSMATILYLASGSIGAWFNEPATIPIIRLLAIGFLLIPFGAITHAMLVRELAADKQAVVSAGSTVSYCVSCVTLAALGCGTLSIAWANLISNAVTALMYIPYRPPGMPWMPSFRHWKGIANFGMATLMTNTLNALSNSLPDVLLGKLSNARAVGLFSRANSTVALFTFIAGSTISYGAVAYMSQSHHRGESLAPTLARTTALLTGVAWPAYALTALLGHDIVFTLYGEKWLNCVPAILPLTVAAAVSILFQYAPPALTAIGRPYLSALPAALTLFSRIVLAFILFNGDLANYAWSIAIATIVVAPVIIFQQGRYLGFGLRPMLMSLRASLAVTLMCLIGGAAIMLVLPATMAPMARLLVLMLALVPIWYGALRLTRHELLPEVHQIVAGVRARLPQFV
ncbi:MULTISPECIES: oligosaccharide flippase family protein [unclassified Massilia]|uniref:oligosaccharide flippase family protein n=1 Tax=unclassified Massilia TaxID=2609279 RepID=UPI00177BB7DD|nr:MULTISPECIES: oligosaccharide flippase family protein [unclassified Massilia]MBD8531349.1 oligosaccharide flippase family protein [Massilia sp. CFBP 13647]MBD8674396.1 oligosaccharide flippase family protein [Massilia sp. CFBP 13721]